VITHLFFDLHGTLIDGVALHPCYAAQMGRIMASRFGGTPQAWEHAHQQIVRDWDSYYADLDLSQGIDQVYEGLYRTTRALFRLTQTPTPPHDDLIRLSRALPGEITPHCDALYPDTKTVIEALHQDGYTLGVTTHALKSQAEGLLIGGGVRDYFNGVIVGVETLEKYERDTAYFTQVARMSGTAPESCLVVDDVAEYLRAARAAGMRTAWIDRKTFDRKAKNVDAAQTPFIDLHLGQELTPLPALLHNLSR
jgi:HAD superfamily hydrolase (TIGR01509 family)